MPGDKAEDAARDQIIQGLVGLSKDFVFYSKSMGRSTGFLS